MSTPKLFRFANITVDLNHVRTISTPYTSYGGAVSEKYYVKVCLQDHENIIEGYLADGQLAANKEYERLLDRWGADK